MRKDPGNRMKQMIVTKTLLAVFLTMVCVATLSAQSGPSIRYFYDDLGRLTRVVDQSGNTASYTYDAVGNILKITRSTLATTTLAVLNFTPQQGGIGTISTTQEKASNPTAAQNSFSINGPAVTVVPAAATSLVVTPPAGPTTELIPVTANGQTALSEK